MSGHDRDYKVGRKNQWRREVWNCIDERLAVAPRNAVVLYLAGPADLDRPLAIRHGFDANNMIAVERNASAVKSLRLNRALTIHDDFLSACYLWPSNTDVHVVFGDFCNGLPIVQWSRIAQLWTAPHLNNAVFAFNFLCGRENNNSFQYIEQWRAIRGDGYEEEKHRGLMVYTEYVSFMFEGILGMLEHSPNHALTRRKTATQKEWDEYHKEFQRMTLGIEAFTRPKLMSYRSEKQTFNTVIFRNPMGAIKGFNNIDEVRVSCDLRAKGHPTRRKISAILAHRTMRARA